MKKVLTAGEIMLRLQPPGYKRIIQTDSYEAVYGGGEANVAVSLAQFGDNAEFFTKLPLNPIADACVNTLRGRGVGVDKIVRGGDRMGIYFCEKGYSQRASQVIYDRARSAISEIEAKDYDAAALLDGVDWLHWTGITPAISDKAADMVAALMKEAKTRGIAVSCDLNFRKKLWSREKANKVMSSLLDGVTYLISNEEDCKDVFGIEAKGSSIEGGKLSADGYAEIGRKVLGMFPSMKAVAFTLRESYSAGRNGWSAILVTADKVFASKHYDVDIIDRVGGGDSFGAGLIHGLVNGWDEAKALEFAVAASCLKHTIEGDFNAVSEDEVLKLMQGDGSGRVQR